MNAETPLQDIRQAPFHHGDDEMLPARRQALKHEDLSLLAILPGTVLVRDFKHYLANQFEALIGNTTRFSEFIKQVTSTRSAVQQTELSHFGPRSLKQKARFMNMGDLLN